jgi:hypothetical protein
MAPTILQHISSGRVRHVLQKRSLPAEHGAGDCVELGSTGLLISPHRHFR